MCFGGDKEAPPPPAPPEVLDQEAPTKKTANQSNSSDLSIGTKKYKTKKQANGLGISQNVKNTTYNPLG